MRPATARIAALGLAPLATAPLPAVLAPAAHAAGPPSAVQAASAVSSASEGDGVSAGAKAVGGGRERVVSYRGVSVPVPAGWEVHRLDAEPGACVRLDRHAIYLGTPGEQTSCPARLIGGAEAVLVQPSDRRPASAAPSFTPSTARRGAPPRADRLARLALPLRRSGLVRVRLPEAGVTITGLYGGHPKALRSVLRATRVSGAWTHDPPSQVSSVPTVRGTHDPAPRPAYVAPAIDQYADMAAPDGHRLSGEQAAFRSTSARTAARASRTSRASQAAQAGKAGQASQADRAWTAGRGFDACAAPSLKAMRAWRGAYSVTNVYIGGVSRGCAQPNLNAGWVRAVRAMGYRLIPTYVGPQAPCTRHRARFDARRPERAARAAAADAVARARALGIPRTKPIYYDMEGYRSRYAWCRTAVLRFLQQWTLSLDARGYHAGVYSSVGSGIRDLGWATGIVKPRAIWFAHWDGKAGVYGSPYLPDYWWAPHRRIKQYRGDHRETHGGVTLYVDSNAVDGHVY